MIDNPIRLIQKKVQRFHVLSMVLIISSGLVSATFSKTNALFSRIAFSTNNDSRTSLQKNIIFPIPMFEQHRQTCSDKKLEANGNENRKTGSINDPLCRNGLLGMFLHLPNVAIASAIMTLHVIQRTTSKITAGGKDESLRADSVCCDSEDILLDLLNAYKVKGALKAEITVEKILKDKTALNQKCIMVLNAMQYILRTELGHEHEETKLTLKADRNMYSPAAGAVLHRAEWLSNFENGSSATSYEAARRMISFSKMHPDVVPKVWIEEAIEAEAIFKQNAALKGRKGQDQPESVAFEKQISEILLEDSKAPTVLRQVVEMVGQRNIKTTFITLYHRHRLAEEQSDTTAFRYNAIFEGNPGTGKSMAARYYATFLQQLDIVKNRSTFIKMSGTELNFDGIKSLKEKLDTLNERFGGIILIEDAPKLLSSLDGTRVLNFIMSMARQKNSDYGEVTWLLSGLAKDMKIMMAEHVEANGHFPVKFSFNDFTDEELTILFKRMMVPAARNQMQMDQQESKVKGPHAVQLPSVSYQKVKQQNQNNTSIKTTTDIFGHLWTFDTLLYWTNDVGGYCRFHPSDVGTDVNPLVFEGQRWQWKQEEKVWETDQGEKLFHYPGQTLNNAPESNISFRCKDDKHLRIAMRRLGRQRNGPGFHNARAVIHYFQHVRSRQAERIKLERKAGKIHTNAELFEFTREDLLGPQVTYDTLASSTTYKELQCMEGLTAVKQSVDSLIKLAVDNARREEEEKPPLDIVINRLFLGNPGTGKTTVAKLYAKLLTEMGLLSKGEVIFKCASDFIGEAIGLSEKKTKDLLVSAQGSVLVIDEAYTFYTGNEVNAGNDYYRKAVIDTIVEQVPARPGDDRAVLLLGYKTEMETMLKNMNPGLTRRFQMDNAFIFEDYDDEALLRILLAQAKRSSLKIDFSVAKRAVESLSLARARPHFGNAGTLENMLSEAKLRMAPGTDKLTLEDFGLGKEPTELDVLDGLFADLVGCNNIKAKMQELRDTVLFAQSRGDETKHLVSYNYLFTGNPGTGKTTVARRMGQAYRALGLLPGDSMHEVSAADLITGYVGQAGKKTREVLERSRGGVLFIDEAYQLNPMRGGQYMGEVVDELVKCLSMPDFQGRLMVIMAGYGADMEQMLNTNQGLRSRFPERIDFQDLDAADAAQLMALRMEQKKLPVHAEDRERLKELAQRLVNSDGFSNGRDVETWSTLAYQQIARTSPRGIWAGTKRGEVHTTFDNLELALDKLLAPRTSTFIGKRAGPAIIAVQDKTRTATEWQVSKPAGLTTRTVEKTADLEESETNTTRQNEDDLDEGSMNHFDGIDVQVLKAIQDGLARQGIFSMEEVSSVARLGLDHTIVKQLVQHLIASGVAARDRQALAMVLEWQQAHQNTQQWAAAKTKGTRLQPIWRCAACGRGGETYIVCNVAPYIERFELVSDK